MTDLNQTPPPAQKRGIKIALAVSVALNLAVVGMIAGVAVHGGPGGRNEMVRDFGFGPFEAALLDEDRDTLRSAIRNRAGDIRAARQQMQADGLAILSALRSDPFDSEALTQALNAQAQHIGDRLKFGTDVIGEFVTGLTPQARAAFADRLEKRLVRGGRGGDDDARDEDDRD